MVAEAVAPSATVVITGFKISCVTVDIFRSFF